MVTCWPLLIDYTFDLVLTHLVSCYISIVDSTRSCEAVRAEYCLSTKGRAELALTYTAQYSDAMPFVNTAVRLALPMIGRDNSILLPKNNTRVADEVLANSNIALIEFLSEKT